MKINKFFLLSTFGTLGICGDWSWLGEFRQEITLQSAQLPIEADKIDGNFGDLTYYYDEILDFNKEYSSTESVSSDTSSVVEKGQCSKKNIVAWQDSVTKEWLAKCSCCQIETRLTFLQPSEVSTAGLASNTLLVEPPHAPTQMPTLIPRKKNDTSPKKLTKKRQLPSSAENFPADAEKKPKHAPLFRAFVISIFEKKGAVLQNLEEGHILINNLDSLLHRINEIHPRNATRVSRLRSLNRFVPDLPTCKEGNGPFNVHVRETDSSSNIELKAKLSAFKDLYKELQDEAAFNSEPLTKKQKITHGQ